MEEKILKIIKSDKVCNECKLRQIEDLINNKTNKNLVELNIDDICDLPLELLSPVDIHYLTDTLIEILISKRILSDDSRVIDKGIIDVNSVNSELITDKIINKIIDVLYFYEIMD